MPFSDSPDALVVASQKPKFKKPRKYKVFLLNDDFTPMDFVVDILMLIFHMNQEQAFKVMMDTHEKGRGICGVYFKDIAETKRGQVLQLARKEGHPLLCDIEPV